MKKSIIRVGILLACFIFAFSSYSFIQRKISANKNPQSIPRYAKSQFLRESKPTNHSFKQGNNTYHFKTLNKTISRKYLNSKRVETNKTSNTISKETFIVAKIDEKLKNTFNQIYKNKFWGQEGGGSGLGSSLAYTSITRNIIYTVVKKYEIKSILDAPCGAMVWMPEILKNLTASNNDFKYHGLDIVEETINNSNEKYKKKYKNWKFTLLDLTNGNFPNDYELIISRDALQHLDLFNVYQVLKSFANVKNAKYLLVGNYLNSTRNRNIVAGDYFSINLFKPPFNLNQYVEIFKEKNDNLYQKYLILYDIPNYLRKIDFEKMKIDVLKF